MQDAIHLKAASAYPAGTVPGMGLAQFAKELLLLSGSQVCVDCLHDLPLRATSILQAVRSGEFHIGELYCGALSAIDGLFQIGSLPFQTSTRASAIQLLAVARPHYERTFEQLGVRLLYISPWPPSGLWTRDPVRSRSDFEGLRFSTYDEMSADVVRSAGGQAVQLPIGEAISCLRDGKLEGVLSSGDGAAGQRLSKHLRCFYAIKYATPISFNVMTARLYHGLGGEHRRLVDRVAEKVERSLWGNLDHRIRENESAMVRSGVKVFPDLDAKLKQALWQGGREAVHRWEQDVPGETAAILGEYFPSPQGR